MKSHLIETIAFDADDTLWQNEAFYQDGQDKLAQMLAEWESPAGVRQALMETEMHNLSIYGYGVKAFTLSMIETALKVSNAKISSETIKRILALGRSMIQAEVILLPQVTDTLQTLEEDYRLMLNTKGDLLDQTGKLSRSGLESYFSFIEVLNQKSE